MPLHRTFGGFSTIHFEPGDGGDGGGTSAGAGAGAGTAGGGGTPPPKKDPPADDTIPRSEATKAFKDRDKAKAGIKLFAKTLGIDPDDVEIEPTDDKENPYKLVAPGLDDIATIVADAKKNKRGTVKWEDRETELNTAHQKKLQKAVGEKQTEVESRDNWIKGAAVVDPIRAACVAEKAIDDDGTGNFDDIVALLTPRVRVDTKTDEETKQLKVIVTPIGEDGLPMTDKDGKPVAVRQLVADFLTKRPKYRQSGFRPGPGAGGYGNDRNKTTAVTNGGGAESPAGFFFGTK